MFEITYWKTEVSDAFGLLSVPGLMILGRWSNRAPSIESFEGIRRIWQGIARSVEFGCASDEPHHQIVAFVRLRGDLDIPPLEPLEASLRLLADRGAAIAWAGGHECDREFTGASGGARCFAAYTDSTGFVCAAANGREYLDKAEIRVLRRAVRQMSAIEDIADA